MFERNTNDKVLPGLELRAVLHDVLLKPGAAKAWAGTAQVPVGVVRRAARGSVINRDHWQQLMLAAGLPS